MKTPKLIQYSWFLIALLASNLCSEALHSQETNQIEKPRVVPIQPLLSQVHRLSEALEIVGRPLTKDAMERVSEIKKLNDPALVLSAIQELFDPFCIAEVDVAPTGAPKVTPGRASPKLLEQGWRTFLVKVINRHHRTGRLFVESPNAKPLPNAPAVEVDKRWMQISSYDGQPLRANLSGLEVEYRIVQIFSRDAGSKEAVLEFTVSGDANGDDALIREWRFDAGKDGWHAMNQMEVDVKDGSLQIESTGDDPFMGAEVVSRGGGFVLRFWAKTDVVGIGQLFWWTKDIPYATGNRQTNFILEPNKEHLYEVPFHAEGELAGIRIDPLVKPGKIRIDWIDLHSQQRNENWAKLETKFQCESSTPVTFRVFDEKGLPAFAKFEVRDSEGRIYPAQSKRLAPDFFFQRHIYRGDGEVLSLPPGQYTITCSRGPETLPEIQSLTVGSEPKQLLYRVQRWIDPSKAGWWSGDHHIHGAGCLHYNNPTEGVSPEDMMRHIMGEDLKVGCSLTWGPCFDFQKQFFTGEVAQESRYPYLLRYDIEVSGFGSHMSGHLNLLNLKNQIYPGGDSKDHWPTLGLSTLKWAKRQGAICGPAHSSIGLTSFVGRLPDTEGKDGDNLLPNFQIPAYDGIGANEFIVDVTHKVPGADGKLGPAVDFISTMNSDRVAEWNMWYHVLNAGLRVAASGETDFPCMSGDRVGIGRVYAQVDGRLTFDKWVQAIGDGRSYVSDGYTHLISYRAVTTDNKQRAKVGVNGSELKLDKPKSVRFSANVAALYGMSESGESKGQKIELLVNGYPVQSVEIKCDGSTKDVTFEVPLAKSSWVAIRAFPNAHTNPIYIVIDNEPILGSLDSVRWCLAGVEQCWKAKEPLYAKSELNEARAAYRHARLFYQRLLDENAPVANPRR